MPLILDLERAYNDGQGRTPPFHAELDELLEHYVGRPSPLYFATERPAPKAAWAAAQDLLQARRAQSHRRAQDQQLHSARSCSRMRMGKKRIIAETGAGQHGVATATVCARFGLQCVDLHGRDVTSSGRRPTCSA